MAGKPEASPHGRRERDAPALPSCRLRDQSQPGQGSMMARPAKGHIPFSGHRTCLQVRDDEEQDQARHEILCKLGRGPKAASK